jgi:HEAT repeat protein
VGAGAEHWARVEALERSDDRIDLLSVIEGERECWHTRTAALRSLARLRAEEAAPGILKLLARDKDPSVREAAIDALGTLRYPRAKKLLERIAREDPSLAPSARRSLASLA